MFDWQDLRLFLAVQRAGSLSAAAPVLRINQTTVGRRLAALEVALGVQLFERVPEGLRLSDAGQAILPQAEAMEEQALAVERTLGGKAPGIAGTVRVACLETFGSRFLAPRLGPLLDRGLRVEILTANRVLDLARREADVAIRFGRPTEPALVARRLGTMAYGLYGSPGYLAARGRNHAFLGYDESLSHVPEAVWLEEQGVAPVLRSNSAAVLVEAARAALGAAILPCWLAEEAGLENAQDVELEREVWIAFHPDLRQAPRIRVVIEHLEAVIGERFGEAAKAQGR